MIPHHRRPVPSVPSEPDPIDQDAFDQVSLIEGERVLRCWRIPNGFVVMTNLRCLSVLRPNVLFWKGEWTLGPEVYFYNMAPPIVLAGRYVRLSEATATDGRTLTFSHRNPSAVREEISAAMVAGRREWEIRRNRERTSITSHTERGPGGSTVYVREVVRTVVKIPCRYCGTLVESTARFCPVCGAPRN